MLLIVVLLSSVLVFEATAFCDTDMVPKGTVGPWTDNYQYYIPSGQCTGVAPVKCNQKPGWLTQQVRARACESYGTLSVRVQPDLSSVLIYRNPPCVGDVIVYVDERCMPYL